MRVCVCVCALLVGVVLIWAAPTPSDAGPIALQADDRELVLVEVVTLDAPRESGTFSVSDAESDAESDADPPGVDGDWGAQDQEDLPATTPRPCPPRCNCRACWKGCQRKGYNWGLCLFKKCHCFY